MAGDVLWDRGMRRSDGDSRKGERPSARFPPTAGASLGAGRQDGGRDWDEGSQRLAAAACREAGHPRSEGGLGACAQDAAPTLRLEEWRPQIADRDRGMCGDRSVPSGPRGVGLGGCPPGQQ